MSFQKKEAKNLPSFKVVLMGDSGVGKTSIVNRYTKDTFESNLLSTAGVCFFSKLLDFQDIKENCKLDVIINFFN
jgi:septin family protein